MMTKEWYTKMCKFHDPLGKGFYAWAWSNSLNALNGVYVNDYHGRVF